MPVIPTWAVTAGKFVVRAAAAHPYVAIGIGVVVVAAAAGGAVYYWQQARAAERERGIRAQAEEEMAELQRQLDAAVQDLAARAEAARAEAARQEATAATLVELLARVERLERELADRARELVEARADHQVPLPALDTEAGARVGEAVQAPAPAVIPPVAAPLPIAVASRAEIPPRAAEPIRSTHAPVAPPSAVVPVVRVSVAAPSSVAPSSVAPRVPFSNLSAVSQAESRIPQAERGIVRAGLSAPSTSAPSTSASSASVGEEETVSARIPTGPAQLRQRRRREPGIFGFFDKEVVETVECVVRPFNETVLSTESSLNSEGIHPIELRFSS